MKKIVMFFLVMLCMNAHAENWKFVIASENMEIHVDTDSVVNTGKFIRVWSVFNYSVSAKAPGTNFSFISDKSLFFFDCRKKKIGRAAQILYSQPYGKGEELVRFSGKMGDVKFESVTPDTIEENFFNFVCTQSGRPKEKTR